MSRNSRKSRRKAARILEFPMRRLHMWAAGAAIAVLVVVLGSWLVLVPGWAIPAAQDAVSNRLGRTLTVKGGAHLSLSPLSIVLDQANISARGNEDESFITARAIRFPVSAGQLLSRHLDVSSVTLEDAEFAFLIDERNEASWTFAAPKTPSSSAFTLNLLNASVRYFDSRNRQALSAGGINAAVQVSPDGEVALSGTAEIRGRLARFDASLKSLQRVHEDGSPLALNVETPELEAGFDGRISTAKVLSLTGPLTVSMPNFNETARWAGIGLEDGGGPGAFTISGSLDSVGRAFAVRQSTINFNQSALSGDVAVDVRNAVPRFQAQLAASAFDLDAFIPAGGAKPGDWGTAPLNFGFLRSIDAEVILETPALSYGPLTDIPARIVLTVASGVLKSSIAARPSDSSNLTFEMDIDSKASPPGFGVSLTSEGGEAGTILAALTGIDWLSGTGILQAKLEGAGRTQQEIVGTLKGTASLALTGGAITGIDVAKALGQASQRIVEGWAEGVDARTEFRTLSSEFKIADGIATMTGGKLASPALNVASEGDVDLLRRAVDLRTDPKLVSEDGKSTGLPVKLVVQGPWGSPRIYPDIEGVLKEPAVAFQKLRDMSVSAGN
jgi:AsmA protein